MKKEIAKEKKISKKKKNTSKKKSSTPKKEENNRLKELLLKPKNQNIIYGVLVLIDIFIIIYSARHNYANYAKLINKERIFIGNTKNLFFGRNYITLIVTFFFFIYILMCNKLLFNKKNTKKSILLTGLFLLILNIVLFYIFTKKIY